MRIYLAGPEVFLADGVELGRRKKALCEEAGFVGLYPLDHGETDPDGIFRANRALMDAADVIIANLTPFRGPSADPGTVFELGMMIGAGRPAFGYSNVGSTFEERSRLFCTAVFDPGRHAFVDAEGMAIEAFGLMDNLMIDRALFAAGAEAVTFDAQDRWRDLSAFRTCLGLVQRTTSRFTSL